jgi:hypothetical protein
MNKDKTNRGFCAAALLAFLALAGVAHAQDQSKDIGFAVNTGNKQVYIGGQATGPIPPNQPYLGGNGDSFLQAFNQNGKLQWTAEFGSRGADWVNGVASDSTGVYAAGVTGAPGIAGQTYYGGTDAYFAKYSLTGQQLWMYEFGTAGDDRLQAAVSDGTYIYVTGYASGSLYGQPFNALEDCIAQKWDQNGNLLWTTEFGSAGTDRCYGIAVNSMGVFVTGRTDGTFAGQVGQGEEDAILTMLDLNGNPIWLVQFGTPYADRGWGIALDSTGIYVTGRTEGVFGTTQYLGLNDDNAYMAKFNFNGKRLWLDEFGSPDFDRGTAAATDSTGTYGAGYTSGALAGNVNYGYKDCFIAKWSPAGKPLWTVQFGSSQDDVCWGVATDSTGAYVSGTAGGTLPGQTKPNGFFLEKFDVNGNSIWTREIEVPNGSAATVN